MRCVMDGSMHSARWLWSWFPDGNAVWQCRQVVRVLAFVDGIRLCCMIVSCLSVTLLGQSNGSDIASVMVGSSLACVWRREYFLRSRVSFLVTCVDGCTGTCVVGCVCLFSSGVWVVCAQLLMCLS